MKTKFVIGRLKTGVPGLDLLLGGGLAEFSFNIIAGAPGCGKTTLAHQIMFALATPERRALFFTVLGEPPLKMLRYQQQYNFFDTDKIGDTIRFVNLAEEAASGSFDKVLARMVEEVEAFDPSLVFVDSFRSVAQSVEGAGTGKGDLQQFVQRLGVRLSSWQATTFLIGEYMTVDSESSPVFTVADGIIWLTQSLHRDSMVRKMQVTKMRGHATLPGLHSFRIGDDGIHVFPRMMMAAQPCAGAKPAGGKNRPPERLSMGVAGLDEMMGGGLPAGYSLLVAGPSGSGKSLLATAFLAEGARLGEKGVIAAFEKSASTSRNPRLDELISDGNVSVVDTRELDLSIDETMHALSEAIQRTGARRVVIDSLSGFELALAPTFSDDFRESLRRMVAGVTALGATILMVCELEDRYGDLRFSPYGTAFLTDAIIVQRYVELKSELMRVMAVVKVRNNRHSHEVRLFTVEDDGIVMGRARPDMEGLLTGHPKPLNETILMAGS